MDCKSCKDRQIDPVSYIVYESAMARNERSIKRLIVALVISIVINLVTMCAFLYTWQLYDYTEEDVTYTYQQDGEGVNIIGDRNGVDYNGPDCYNTETKENPNP